MATFARVLQLLGHIAFACSNYTSRFAMVSLLTMQYGFYTNISLLCNFIICKFVLKKIAKKLSLSLTLDP